MIIQASLLTLGTDPEINFVGQGTVQVKFSAAENHNRNVGTYDNPDWKQVGTSWYDFVAYGDTAQEIIEDLNKGDGFRLKKGVHKWKKVEKEGEDTQYFPTYKILEYEKYTK